MRAGLVAVVLAAAPAASAQEVTERATEPDDDDAEPENDAEVELGGYLTPGYAFAVRSNALPADRLEHGFLGDAGITIEAELFEIWSAALEVSFDPSGVDVVNEVFFEETRESVRTEVSPIDGVVLEEASVSFDPWKFFGAKLGLLRIPFTLTQQADNTALLFPSRAPPNETFQSGADLGGELHTSLWGERITGSFGAYEGRSLGFYNPEEVRRAVTLAFRADVNPFGAFDFDEGDPGVGPFRLGGGFGLLYTPAEVFDAESGQEKTTRDEVRIAAALRMAVRGAYVAVEYLRRHQTDALSSRPEIADGGFGQASFFFRVHPRVGLEPVARLGFVADDQAFDPRLTGWIDAGVSLYPLAHRPKPDQVKITVLYQGARHFTVEEETHGAALATRFLF